MDQPPEAAVPLSIVLGGLVFLLCGLTVVTVAARRISQGQPVLPYVRRRPVPWQAFHVGAIAAAYVVLLALAQRLTIALFALPVPVLHDAAPEQPVLPDPLIFLLEKSHTLPTLLLCFLAAVIVAPIVEEFLFRLVLQGWLEAVEARRRRQIPFLREVTPGAVPVLLVALLFAGIHYRPPAPQIEPRTIACLLMGNIVASLAVLAFGIGLLRWDAAARADDLGVVPGKLLGDLRLGVLLFAAVAGLIYLLKIAFSVQYGDNAATPLALFPFALVLGVVYCRTHRLVPCIVLHMSLNFTSLAMAWFRVGM